MGYELDRIMGQYGFTPSAGVGVAPVAPVYGPGLVPASGQETRSRFGFAGQSAAPAAPTEEQQIAAYNALLAKYNAGMPEYLAAKARAEQVAAQNAAALKAGNMYAQSQFGYQSEAPKAPEVAPVTPQSFTPLAPLAYMGKTLGTNAAGERTGFDTTGGMGGEGHSAGPGADAPGPSGVSTTGGFGMTGALGTVGQAALGMVANAMSTPNTPAQQDAISVVDATPTSTNSPNGFGTTGTDTGEDGTPGDGLGDGPGDGGIGGTEGSGNSGGDNGADAGGDYARGGIVRRRFAEGGLNDLAGKYDLGVEGAPMLAAPEMTGTTPAMSGGFAETAPVVEPAAAPAQRGVGMPPGLEQMLAKYQGGESAYGSELKAARALASQESDAFAKMLQGAMDQSGQAAPSKAEMYFRLASAFGAPTRTGHFTESLAAAGKTMGDYAKETREADRASKSGRLQLALEAQKLKMSGAKEDLNTLRTLAGEEMKDKRAVATKLLEQYIKSGEPESAAGKQAKDEGMRPGSPEFQARVAKIAENNVDKQMAQINATLANVSVAQANQALAQQKFGFQQEQSTKLTGPEMKLKTDTEDMVAQTDQALANLKKAYSLNPNTFDASLVDVAQRKVLEAAGSKDPKVQNTREMENMLEKAALSSLKATFPGAISNDERKALQDVQGLGAKSKEERSKIMKNGYAALKTVSERARKRLNDINSGVYRNTGSIDEGEK